MFSYIPPAFNINDKSIIKDFVTKNGFATLVSVDKSGETFISHLPVLLEAYDDEWRFSLHLANANEHSKVLTNAVSNVLIFKGPHCYISPKFYTKTPAVPTWNYAVAHFQGRVDSLSSEQLALHLRAIVNQYEPELFEDENIMPAPFIDRLGNAITGFNFIAEQSCCKFKLGQNRSSDDYSKLKVRLAESGIHEQLVSKLM